MTEKNNLKPEQLEQVTGGFYKVPLAPNPSSGSETFYKVPLDSSSESDDTTEGEKACAN